MLARLIADQLSQKWGKPVIVENKTGAQGNLAMAYVAKAAPDGYTLAVVPVGNATVNPSLFKELPYDMKEFAPVSQIAAINNVLVVAAKSPARTLKELVALGKAKDALTRLVGSDGPAAPQLAVQSPQPVSRSRRVWCLCRLLEEIDGLLRGPLRVV